MSSRHILSNVGRVVARDSSRSNATAQDLFIALCEDHTIYDLFKKMKGMNDINFRLMAGADKPSVYEQIEQLSKAPKVRRSKSLTRNEKSSRTSSPQQDMSSTKESSVDTSVIVANASSGNPGSKPSIEKTRTMKVFRVNSRSSIDGDVPNGHKRSNSFASVSEKSAKHPASQIDDTINESHVLQQEFDDLMRSSSTMKVSLTPDRLKTMEVYKQEKESGNRPRPGPASEFEISQPATRAAGRRPSLLHRVDSIKEDEEESGGSKPLHPPLPSTRSRQASVSARPTTAPVSSRVRALSTSGSSAALRLFAKPSPQTLKPVPTTATTTVDPSQMQPYRQTTKIQDSSLPTHLRKAQRDRDSLDLDEVMGASDDEPFVLAPAKLSARPATPRSNVQDDASANTKDLINFLSKGPPDIAGSLFDITTDSGTSQNGKSKGTGRLQKMISKLSLGNGERSRGTDDISRLPVQPTPKVHSQSSLNNLSSLANRPVPPRPPPVPRPISPPDLPCDPFEDDSPLSGATAVQRKSSAPTVPVSPKQRGQSETASTRHLHDNRHVQPSSNGKTQQYAFANGHAQPQRQHTVENIQSVIQSPRNFSGQRSDSRSSSIPSKVQSRSQITSPSPPASPNYKPLPAYVDRGTEPHISYEDALHMHRLFSKATTADECRLILDMFLARAGVLDPNQFDKSQPPYRDQSAATDSRLQAYLLELFLGGEPAIVTEPALDLNQGNL
ncbi:hypothetical protein C0993_001340 [Termitomyces sp. T159_Od127]|nr:hypothetical protein C0993_001340 [Termitomyces sp. T159_Od127]